MGVKWLLNWQVGSGTTLSSHTYAEAVKAVENLPGNRTGRWQVTCALHRPTATEPISAEFSPTRELFCVKFSENADKLFLVIRQNYLIAEAAMEMQTILDKLQIYRHRLSMNYEGFEYTFGDLEIRVGRAVLSSSEALRGIVIEVEYLPTDSLEQSQPIIQEFVNLWQSAVTSQGLSGRFVLLEPNYSEYNLSDRYGNQHTALQYVLISTLLLASRS